MSNLPPVVYGVGRPLNTCIRNQSTTKPSDPVSFKMETNIQIYTNEMKLEADAKGLVEQGGGMVRLSEIFAKGIEDVCSPLGTMMEIDSSPITL